MKQRGGSGETDELANPEAANAYRKMTPEQQAAYHERIRRIQEDRQRIEKEEFMISFSSPYKLYTLIANEHIDTKFQDPFRNAKQELVRRYYFDIITPQMALIQEQNYAITDAATNSFKEIVKQFIDDGVLAFTSWVPSYFKSADSKFHTFQRMLKKYNELFPGRGGSRKRTKKTKNRKTLRRRR